jgi:hypothetical protein
MNTLARPSLRLLERRPTRPSATVPVAPPTLLQRLGAWVEKLPEPRPRHGMGSWETLR